MPQTINLNFRNTSIAQRFKNSVSRLCSYPVVCSSASMGANVDPSLPPYTMLSSPVYSLVTSAEDGSKVTMNLVTYASPVSLKPRMFALGLYDGTLSRENMLSSGRGTLQILGRQHAPLFELLGKCSGKDIDKLTEIRRMGFSLTEATKSQLPVLSDCIGAMDLMIQEGPFPAGDHAVVLCSVEDWVTFSDIGEDDQHFQQTQALYTGTLRSQGIM